MFRVLGGIWQSYWLIRKLKPDVCFSKGGFVSIPIVIAAHWNHVPTVCHESDMTPGLANRIAARFADVVATTFPECAACIGGKGVMDRYPRCARTCLTANGNKAWPWPSCKAINPYCWSPAAVRAHRRLTWPSAKHCHSYYPKWIFYIYAAKATWMKALQKSQATGSFEYLQQEWPRCPGRSRYRAWAAPVPTR